jgi:Cu(I)/Ag(I) efflux system membrane fusion protein
MTTTDPAKHTSDVRNVLVRWCIVLAAVVVLAVWATWRMQTAASKLSNTLTAASGGAPAETAAPKAPKAWYRCTMPECGDQGSDDPDSRCPVCGMKREPVILDTATDTDDAEISLSERARRLAELATEPVTRRHLIKRIRTVGKVTYDETRRKMVSAWTGGRIDRLFADFTGMVVGKGDHLVEIYSPELVSAQEELLQAVRSFEAISADSLESSRRRAGQLIVSAQQKLELLGITERQIDELKRTGHPASHLVVYAPLGGTIVRKWAMEGMYVKTGDPLYEIADLTQVWLLLDLYEADLPWIMPFQSVKVTAQSLPGEEFDGRIVFVDPLVDKMTRTIKVRVNVANPDLRLKPEMFVIAEIDAALGEGGKAATPEARGDYACPMHPWETADTLTICPICEMDLVPVASIAGHPTPRAAVPVLSVPHEAVMRTGPRSLVYIETDPGVYRGIEIRVGPVAQDSTGQRFYPVLSGLDEGQNVVTRGNFVIDSQMQITGKPSLFSSRGLGAAPPHDHGTAHTGQGNGSDD